MQLRKDGTTGSMIVPHGITFADLFAAWEKQDAHLLHLMEIYDKPDETEEEEAHLERD